MAGSFLLFEPLDARNLKKLDKSKVHKKSKFEFE